MLPTQVQTTSIKKSAQLVQSVPSDSPSDEEKWDLYPTVSQSDSDSIATPATLFPPPEAKARLTGFLKPHSRNSFFDNNRNNDKKPFVSLKVANIALNFWNKHVENLPMITKLEVGSAIYYQIMASSKDLKNILRRRLKTKGLESLAMKFVDTIGWLIRAFTYSASNLVALLTKLGALHEAMGVNKFEYFGVMLKSIHETLLYYFPGKYTMEVKYSVQQIVVYSAQIMCGQKTVDPPNLGFLKSVNVCLSSTVGREYLFQYLQEVYCDEIVVFCTMLHKFKECFHKSKENDDSTDTENAKSKFTMARDIVNKCINPDADFAINIDYSDRAKIMKIMKEIEKKYADLTSANIALTSAKVLEFGIDISFFNCVEREMEKMIWQSHWRVFKRKIKSIHSCQHSQHANSMDFEYSLY